MADINHVSLIGRLTRDAEIKYTQAGTAVSKFSIAVNRRARTDATGNKNEETDFFDVTLWGKQAEGLHKYLIKGKQVAIEGRLQQDRWTDQNGASHSRVSIVAENLQLLGGSRVDLPQGQAPQQAPQNWSQAPQQGQNWNQMQPAPAADFPEDIPF
jgi:single-strand DNA-binding protein